MLRRTIPLAAAALALAAFIPTAPAQADPGVFPDHIVFGQAAALTGPAAALGQGMRTGILAAFAEANRAGGVHGRRLVLVSRDDGYDPGRSIAATRSLIDRDKVFALIGAVGTPTSAAAEPIAAGDGVPFIGPFTGAAFLRAPDATDVINYRASYAEETEQMVAHLTGDLGITHIGIFYQDDAYGRAGLAGVEQALARRHLALAVRGTYPRNTTAVKGALIAISTAEPQAVIMVGAYKPCAIFIRLARAIGFDPVFVNISFVGSRELAAALGPAGVGVAVTQVVPFPYDLRNPVVAGYQTALRALDPAAQAGFTSFEGYLVGRMTSMALARIKGPPTRTALLDAFTNGVPFRLGNLILRFRPQSNQASHQVWLTVIGADGRFHPITRLSPSAR
ncbi:MAG: ABC transporter substrate-binding protein [Acetobacteraceae bacterium]